MENLPNCVKCGSEYTYENGNLYVCPECAHEWLIESDNSDEKPEKVVRDAYGNVLKDGDSVTVIKDIKVKGSALDIKVGVKIKDIRLVDEFDGHNLDVKVKGFGAMLLKSVLVKKCN